jgi:putative ABC transport system permease protein
MSTIMRGARNAFRNTIRTGGVTVILALSVGLALVMFLSLKAVQSRIQSVQSSIGNDITIQPAGYTNFSDVNNALTTSELSKISTLAHITKVTETLTDRVTTIGSSTPSFGRDGSSSSNSGTTSLASPVTLNANRSGNGNGPRLFVSGGGQLPANFSLPISVLGTTDPTSVNGSSLTLASGSQLNPTSSANEALISSTMASKNDLKVGSTFTAYSTSIKVAGIFSTSTQGADNTVVFTLPTLQALTGQPGDITAADATVDSLTNMTTATNEVKNSLGSSADVSNSEENAQSAIAPLQNIKTITTYSLIGALAAGSVIIFLTMLMIVRERRREIGVLKAIGASNLKIVIQFVSEALTLTLAGAVIGTIGGLILANPILSLLVTSNSTTATTGPGGGFRGGGGFRTFGGGFGRAIGGGINGARAGLNTLHTVVGYEVLLYGLAAAVIIAVIGSALPAFAIAKVRPAEVLRGE